MAAAIPALIGQLEKYAPAAARENPCTLLESWACDNALFGSPGMEMLINTSVMYGDMASLLKNLTLGQDSDVRRSGKRSYFPDAVSLMTLHCSKGLEYPTVFLCGVSDGLIPFRNRGGDCNLDEERRLFYVGVTRAKDELILLSPLAASPFVEDFPKEHHVKGNALPSRPGAGSKQLSLF
jgi:superfamily I DNA/RNA helicase